MFKAKVKRPTVTIEATVIRADGTIEEHGVIARSGPSLKRVSMFRYGLGKLFRGRITLWEFLKGMVR